jgi:lipopolysaccharide-induced tumor necrosis factor-alpha factor
MDPNAPPIYASGSTTVVYGGQPPYPQQGYPAQPYPQQQQQVYVATQPTVVVTSNVVRFGSSPVQMVCPYCKNTVVTSTHYDTGAMVWLVCLALFFFTFCCFFIAFLINDLKDVVHTCPNCRNVVGRCSRL